MTPPTPVPPTTHPLDPRSWVVTRRDRASWALTAVLALVALCAVYGGVGLVRDGMGMPADWLENTPFPSWTLPGVALLATVALPQAVACWLTGTGHRWGAVAGVLAGTGLCLWIGVQLLVLQRYFFLQPVIFALGLVEVGLAAWWAGRDGTA